MDITEIFESEPTQWGLRGDPLLWKDLAKSLSIIKMPDTKEEFERMAIEKFEFLTGVSIESSETLVLDKYKSHGISSGGISVEFWREKGIPLLVSRYAKT